MVADNVCIPPGPSWLSDLRPVAPLVAGHRKSVTALFEASSVVAHLV